MFSRHPDCGGMTKAALTATMKTLMADGRVVIQSHGRGRNKRSHLVIGTVDP